MGIFAKKDPCAICGGKVSGLFAPKVEGQFVCKECCGNLDLPAEALKEAAFPAAPEETAAVPSAQGEVFHGLLL